MKRLTSNEMSFAYSKAKGYIEKWAQNSSDDKSRTSDFWQTKYVPKFPSLLTAELQ